MTKEFPISLITGMTKTRLIGKDNDLPWNIPDDLKNFKEVTTGASVIMGLNTFKSIGRPLPGRNNIVLDFEPQEIEGVTVCTSIPDAIKAAEEYSKKTGANIFCIGGVGIYKQFLPIVDKLYISWMKKEYEGNMYFPEFNLDEWEIESKKDFPDFEFIVYNRKQK